MGDWNHSTTWDKDDEIDIKTNSYTNLGGISDCSPELLKVQWNETRAGLASTEQCKATVSCFRAPKRSPSLLSEHTGASGNKNDNNHDNIKILNYLYIYVEL